MEQKNNFVVNDSPRIKRNNFIILLRPLDYGKHEGERLSFPNEFFEAAQTVIGWWCWIKDNHIKKYATK